MDQETNEVPEIKKFDISKEDKAYVRRINGNTHYSLDLKEETLMGYFEIEKEELYEMLASIKITLTESQFSLAKLHKLKESKRYLISSAQNASPVHNEFLTNMEAYAKHIGAEIGIIATRYKNPTSFFKEEGDVWDQKTHPYLIANKQYIHNNVIVLADLKIQATSPNPTNGIELFGDNASCIVGSPRIEMRSVPVLPGQMQKFLYSTGTVTQPNFTDSVAGGKAEAHHSYGFVIVEIEDDEIVHLRSVSASDDGSFNDLIFRVQDGVITQEAVECLVWGDSHFAQKQQNVTDAFRNLCDDLGVTTSILHDVWDSQSINTHNLKDPIVQHELMKTGKNSLQKELSQLYIELDWFEKNMNRTLVIGSNHDDMLDRAMSQGDWRDNLVNAELFVEMLALKLSSKANDGIIAYYINRDYKNIEALGVDASYILHGVELAIHGHKGPNGSRGNIQAFSKLSNKTIIGHSHSPSIRWGCYQVGISCQMQHGYNKGLSGWAYAGCTLNKHGKRQMIIFNKDTLSYTTLY